MSPARSSASTDHQYQRHGDERQVGERRGRRPHQAGVGQRGVRAQADACRSRGPRSRGPRPAPSSDRSRRCHRGTARRGRSPPAGSERLAEVLPGAGDARQHRVALPDQRPLAVREDQVLVGVEPVEPEEHRLRPAGAGRRRAGRGPRSCRRPPAGAARAGCPAIPSTRSSSQPGRGDPQNERGVESVPRRARRRWAASRRPGRRPRRHRRQADGAEGVDVHRRDQRVARDVERLPRAGPPTLNSGTSGKLVTKQRPAASAPRTSRRGRAPASPGARTRASRRAAGEVPAQDGVAAGRGRDGTPRGEQGEPVLRVEVGLVAVGGDVDGVEPAERRRAPAAPGPAPPRARRRAVP